MHGAIEIRTRIPGREIEQPELGIDGRCLPYRGAAVRPDVVVGRPGTVTELPWAGDRME
jgi:hypothetical protein